MQSRTNLWAGLVVAGGILLMPTPAVAAPVYIDFGSYSAAPTSVFGAAAGAAGVWNNVATLGTFSDLLDVFGMADITVSAESADGTGGFGTTDTDRLMRDNIYTTPGKTWSVSLTGLTDGVYDVYLYEPANAFLGSGSGAVNGVAFAGINGTFNGAFVRGTNYLLLTDVAVTNGWLTATGGEAGALSGLAGMQLVDRNVSPTTVPEPGTLVLLGAALAAAGIRPRGRI